MEKELSVKLENEVLSLVTDITFSCVPDWYNSIFTDLKMNLIIPKHRDLHKGMPAILWLCGGAYSVVSNSVWMPEMMYFARKGFVVASAEYRTSNKAIFPAGIIDVKSAIRYLKAHAEKFCIDPSKIFVMGESAGGTYACLAGVTKKIKDWDQGDNLSVDSSVAGVVDFYGIVNIEASPIAKNGAIPSWVTGAFLGEDSYDENAKNASAINYVDHESVPFLILHGTKDTTVPIAQSDDLYEKLNDNNIYTEYYKIKGAEHGEDYFYQNEVKDLVYSFLRKICNGDVK
jgi:acetyl esterase/lipase